MSFSAYIEYKIEIKVVQDNLLSRVTYIIGKFKLVLTLAIKPGNIEYCLLIEP